MNKRIIILSVIVLLSGKIYSGPGVYVDNQSGAKIWVQIDKGETLSLSPDSRFFGFEPIKKGSALLPFIPSKGGGKRSVYWIFDKDVKDFEAGNKKVMRNSEGYLFPDKIVIGKTGKYKMQVSGSHVSKEGKVQMLDRVEFLKKVVLGS